ncbi:hypothetical protein, conserved in T. vivax [Trypanosoma vivax Y486]|uniref:Uncharacterized protein n=1 Tax=Trypanosoma vivax (strain Y486) TaxID=1055687 RepID=F9WU76_TRYVY|nr:hypothetical protein, conserved in T. vivax [Trypanosoma vivax Y486]|eukprot:CCD21124.1 hypothetical protein, conserved in T. vivax [Trypanosoma vivax Y486]
MHVHGVLCLLAIFAAVRTSPFFLLLCALLYVFLCSFFSSPLPVLPCLVLAARGSALLPVRRFVFESVAVRRSAPLLVWLFRRFLPCCVVVSLSVFVSFLPVCPFACFSVLFALFFFEVYLCCPGPACSVCHFVWFSFVFCLSLTRVCCAHCSPRVLLCDLCTVFLLRVSPVRCVFAVNLFFRQEFPARCSCLCLCLRRSLCVFFGQCACRSFWAPFSLGVPLPLRGLCFFVLLCFSWCFVLLSRCAFANCFCVGASAVSWRVSLCRSVLCCVVFRPDLLVCMCCGGWPPFPVVPCQACLAATLLPLPSIFALFPCVLCAADVAGRLPFLCLRFFPERVCAF